jgi:hypothetical protein
MTNSFQITIPITLRDIKLSQWQKYVSLYNKNKDNEDPKFLNLKTLEVFCGVDLMSITKLPLNTFDEILDHVSNVLSQDVKRVNTFKLVGTDGVEVEFGLIPNLDKMSYGEFEDLENYIYDDKTLHKAMAVLYRPIAFKKGDRYVIHEYRGTAEMAEVMKDTPLDVALGARVFFWTLARKLGNYILDYTLKELLTKEENTSENRLAENGEDIKQYIHSLMDKLKELEKLQDKMFTNV